MKDVIFVSGGKGGVGKSTVAMAVIDTLLEQERQVVLFDSDTSNPDVFKAYKDLVVAEASSLDLRDGWIRLLNVIHDNPDATIVVNSAARSNEGVARFGDMLTRALPELKRNIKTLWVISRQRDSLELLKQYIDQLGCNGVHVVRNLYVGSPERFELYNGSNLKNTIEAAGGKTVDFPELGDRVADLLMNQRLPISKASKDLDFGERIELEGWRAKAIQALEGVLDEKPA